MSSTLDNSQQHLFQELEELAMAHFRRVNRLTRQKASFRTSMQTQAHDAGFDSARAPLAVCAAAAVVLLFARHFSQDVSSCKHLVSSKGTVTPGGALPLTGQVLQLVAPDSDVQPDRARHKLPLKAISSTGRQGHLESAAHFRQQDWPDAPHSDGPMPCGREPAQPERTEAQYQHGTSAAQSRAHLRSSSNDSPTLSTGKCASSLHACSRSSSGSDLDVPADCMPHAAAFAAARAGTSPFEPANAADAVNAAADVCKSEMPPVRTCSGTGGSEGTQQQAYQSADASGAAAAGSAAASGLSGAAPDGASNGAAPASSGADNGSGSGGDGGGDRGNPDAGGDGSPPAATPGCAPEQPKSVSAWVHPELLASLFTMRQAASVLAHDMRNPLTLVLNVPDILAHQEGVPAPVMKQVQQVKVRHVSWRAVSLQTAIYMAGTAQCLSCHRLMC